MNVMNKQSLLSGHAPIGLLIILIPYTYKFSQDVNFVDITNTVFCNFILRITCLSKILQVSLHILYYMWMHI